MDLDPEVKTQEQLSDILLNITFNPSCVDMDWAWKVEEVWRDDPEHFHWMQSQADNEGKWYQRRAVILGGWLISTTFKRPDRATGSMETGRGREWFVPVGSTMSGVVKTAFAACKMILEHELMESFKFDRQRPFDPHNTVQELVSLQYRKDK